MTSIEQSLYNLQQQYIRTFHTMQQDLDNLRAQRQRAKSMEARQHAEAAIAAKRAELLALRREAWETAGVWL